MAMTIVGICGLLKPPLVAWPHATRNNTYLCTQIRRASQSYPNLTRRQLQQSWRVTNSSIYGHSKEEAARLIWRAVKLPIYSVALVPLTVGSATAYLQMRTFDAGRFCLFLFSSVLIIMWLNLSNDVYDFDTGADKDKKESVVNITGRRSGVLYMAYICLVIGCGGLLWGSMQAGDGRVAFLLASAILCGYVYQCPPCRLSYLGLGEPLCFAAFGPLATNAFYFSQSSKSQTGSLPFSITVLCVSILTGITTTLILFCSHFHQIDGDREVGKISPLVRMGTERGSVVVKYGVVSLYLLLFAFVVSKALPLPCLVCITMMIERENLIRFLKMGHSTMFVFEMKDGYDYRNHINNMSLFNKTVKKLHKEITKNKNATDDQISMIAQIQANKGIAWMEGPLGWTAWVEQFEDLQH